MNTSFRSKLLSELHAIAVVLLAMAIPTFLCWIEFQDFDRSLRVGVPTGGLYIICHKILLDPAFWKFVSSFLGRLLRKRTNPV